MVAPPPAQDDEEPTVVRAPPTQVNPTITQGMTQGTMARVSDDYARSPVMRTAPPQRYTVPPPPPPPPPSTQQQAYPGNVEPGALERLVNAASVIDNPMLSAAVPLITFAVNVRATVQQGAASQLQHYAIDEVKKFEEKALGRGAKAEDVVAARYVLCSFVDECVLSTPWGGESAWAQQSLLNIFHNETWGGEKVFVILDRIQQQPARYLDLLEFIDTCLGVGFEGRFRVIRQGQYELEQIRSDLQRTIRNERGDRHKGLSVGSEPHESKRNWRERMPLWVILALSACLLVGIYAVFEVEILRLVEPLRTSLKNL